MTHRSFLLAAVVAALLVPSVVQATSCPQWNRLSDPGRYQLIDQMIQDAMSSNRGRRYRTDKGRVGRCLESRIDDIYWDFEGICANPAKAHRSALQTRFMNYLWTCVN